MFYKYVDVNELLIVFHDCHISGNFNLRADALALLTGAAIVCPTNRSGRKISKCSSVTIQCQDRVKQCSALRACCVFEIEVPLNSSKEVIIVYVGS